MYREELVHPLPVLQLDDCFHFGVFKKRRHNAEYQTEVAKSNSAIKALKHLIAQFDRVELLVKHSRGDLRCFTVK
jgi:hypothetical protein